MPSGLVKMLLEAALQAESVALDQEVVRPRERPKRRGPEVIRVRERC
jgi:hypothetical protein